MSKIFIFSILWWLLGNPFLALLVMLAIIYVLDRRFVGIFPSFVKPLKRMSRIRALRRQAANSPSDMSARYDLARLLLERRRYGEARQWLEQIGHAYEDSAEYWDDLGTTLLHTGEPATGEQYILKALEWNPRVKYGEPYLRLASYYARHDQQKALQVLERFREIQSSSCRAYYMLGQLERALGHQQEAKQSFREAVNVYRSLPKYKKRSERGWAIRSWLRSLV
ncbi:tetratricopeptide repeat protein [Paenibacillus sp. WLX2291]|uniref:tetratricopeptide repeat protein n=1 Tax=Paenibacillus sp. WLX2291 TaxID=3296934 RepID=UPI003983FAE1